ncbi:MAG: hypothetical protein A2Y73_01560 [Chloroflexi bacterium RBG_13_56_8]|nr:MAG: hypothetical protein A2Y73_01560 [Chloroflexi bacterium RBG_13_56_8]
MFLTIIFLALSISVGLAFTDSTMLFCGTTSVRADVMALDMPPQMPASFFGTVQINGHNVSPGTIISARSNGVIFAQAISQIWGDISVYHLEVPAESEQDIPPEEVEFMVGGLLAEPKATWNSGESQNLDLIAEAHQFYLPLIVK